MHKDIEYYLPGITLKVNNKHFTATNVDNGQKKNTSLYTKL